MQEGLYEIESEQGDVFQKLYINSVKGLLELVSVNHKGDYNVQGSMSIRHPNLPSLPYSKMVSTIPYLFGLQSQSALILGLGVGTVPKTLKHFYNMDVTVVEYDKNVIDIFEEYFNPDNLEIEVIQGDAYKFPLKTEKKKDMIFVDIFNETGFPLQSSDKKFTKELIDNFEVIVFNYCCFQPSINKNCVESILDLSKELPYYTFHRGFGNLIVVFTKRDILQNWDNIPFDLYPLDIDVTMGKYYKGQEFPNIPNLKKADTEEKLIYRAKV